ncbi:hypothetical protein C0J52_02382 [Blattella germanica]|nr:hypothetical protein C0J52_02382 [Blattella germanica]
MLLAASVAVILGLMTPVRCGPIPTTPGLPPAAALKFMRQFGYLEQGPPDSEALYSENAIVDAIKTVQMFGGLNQTGTLDDATLELMVAKRCGVPDVIRQKGKRQKRFVIGAEDKKVDLALDLLRRLPPRQIEEYRNDLIRLVPSIRNEIQPLVQQPLKIARDEDIGKDYLLCDHNRDGDSYRSPWSNVYYPLSDDGPLPSESLRKLEIDANRAFDQYKDLYFGGGVSSVYLWDLENGFAGAILIKKTEDNSGIKGCWDSIHIIEIQDKTDGKCYHYKLTSTVVLWLQSNKLRSGTMDVGGNLTRKMEVDAIANDASAHIVNLGRMVESMENKIRKTFREIYFSKTGEIISRLRNIQPIHQQRQKEQLTVDVTAEYRKSVVDVSKLETLANWSPKIGEFDMENEMKRAFKTWSGYGRLSFQQVHDPNADIIIAFGRGAHQDGYPFDGPGSILAHAFYPYEMDNYGGDIHFDDDENWKVVKTEDPSEDGVDFFTVAVHELGHSLGLAHSPVSTSIMFPYYKGFQKHFQLGYDDILGMYELYISKRLIGDTDTPQDEDTNPDDDDGRGDDTDNDVNPTPDDDYERRTNDEPSERNTPVTPSTPATPNTPTTDDTVTYTGDDESVEDHKGHDDKHGIPGSPKSPDICDGNFDALAVLRGELFVFKKQYLWRLSQRGEVQQGYPVPFRQLFWKLPSTISNIDAIYQRERDGSIIIFTGKKYWVYNGDNFIEGSPRPLTDFGLPPYVDQIDAAMVWNKNGKTFLFRLVLCIFYSNFKQLYS